MTKETKETKKSKSKSEFSGGTSRYKRIKLSAETVCVIKKALLNYDTKELETERFEAVDLLKKEDFFLVLYYYEKRKHVKRTSIADGQLRFPTIKSEDNKFERTGDL